VRIVHAFDGEDGRPGEGIDGGVIEWIGPNGVVPAEPVGGYPDWITARARHALHGRPAFASADSLLADGRPAWRVDLVRVPDDPGPWRLRLRFASNATWRGRGWFVVRLDALAAPPAEPFPVLIDAASNRLVWSWPWPEAANFRIEGRTEAKAPWEPLWSAIPDLGGSGFDHGVALAELGNAVDGRRELRVVAEVAFGAVASRPVVYYRDGEPPPAPLLGVPYPNPGRDEIQVPITGAGGERLRLSLHDLAGRRLRAWDLPGGDYLLRWDGRDGSGRRVPAGVYFFRLEASSRTPTRKVVWLP
jgi:hypothetical protein